VAIETVLLDAGGVLVFPNWERVAETFARHGWRISAETLREADPEAKFFIDVAPHGTMSDADRGSRYFRLVLAKAGIPPDASIEAPLNELWAYHTERNLWEFIPGDVFPALGRLTALGVRLAVASNANGTLQHMFARVGLARYFHTICDSCIEGVEKPDRRFLEIVLERAGARAETSIHVGDLYNVDVAGARNAGVRPVLMDPHDLYRDYAVERVKSLDELVTFVASVNHEGHEDLRGYPRKNR
jgi:HAD superfamily hydrolase (TIGR01549 family)